jgi:glycosyltransferase involved in cell wall biosynthesis
VGHLKIIDVRQRGHLAELQRPTEEETMAKLVVQIPCFNEAETLPIVLAGLPRTIPGIDTIEWLVIDDGSTDGTAAVAQALGVHHVVCLPRHQGLARAFMAGVEAAVRAGADIIVNTDGDHQYSGEDIPKLIEPILTGQAEIVVGSRPIEGMEFSIAKKWLQRLGSYVTRLVSNTEVTDAPSGFRAMSREAALKLHVFGEYTYTVEMIIQAGRKGLAITSVPIRTNRALRPSRLVRGTLTYLIRQILTMLRVFMTYKPLRFFAVPGVGLFIGGFLIGLRFLYHYLEGAGSGHIQSLILAALMMGMGFFLAVIGLVADLLGVNRALLEGLDWRLKHLEETIRDVREASGPFPTK